MTYRAIGEQLRMYPMTCMRICKRFAGNGDKVVINKRGTKSKAIDQQVITIITSKRFL